MALANGQLLQPRGRHADFEYVRGTALYPYLHDGFVLALLLLVFLYFSIFTL
jgi:hypothetical protein